jgi:hypothetical protein
MRCLVFRAMFEVFSDDIHDGSFEGSHLANVLIFVVAVVSTPLSPMMPTVYRRERRSH